MNGPAIEATGLQRGFGAVRAVDGLDLEVGTGEWLALLGPNGAGKSTTIGMLTTLVRPDAGRARVAGFDVVREPRRVRERIGIVFQDPTLDAHLTVAENLATHAVLYGMPRRERDDRSGALLAAFGLEDRRDELVRRLSGGLRRRLELVRGLLHRPDVLFLDEPTLGLDPRARATLLEQLLALRAEQSTTVLLTTHYLAEAEHCDRVAIMDGGRIVACDTPDALRAAHGPGATLDDVYLARTSALEDDAVLDRRDQGRLEDARRSGRVR